ncbi:MAG: glycosyltransferase family 2 protein [Gaiella sp.]|nr:glycosyltransferase family 2 protein [Gaiella sp.]
MADPRPRAACVVVTHDALPWIEKCLASVAGTQTVVVDNGSSDGTPDAVRERFPAVRVVEAENRGLAAGWNRGIAETDAEHVLVLNADAWLVEDALSRLLAVADAHPRAAAVGPRLQNADGTLQRSVRGYPTLWRLATEYLYLRKLAPRSQALNAFYGAGFDHESEREVEWVMGACFLLRRGAYDEVGPFDERYFLFSEEVDWMCRAANGGWSVVFTPEARCVHVGGASHGGRMFRENVRGNLRYLSLHGRPGEAEQARKLLRASLLVRGRLHRGERARLYREAAAWLGSGDVETLLAR